MLPQQNRLQLRNQPDFFQHAKRVYSPLFIIFWQKNTQPIFQATVIVSKKVSGKSTERNALKRKVRNALLPYSKENRSVKVIISVHPKMNVSSFEEIEQELQKTISRIQ